MSSRLPILVGIVVLAATLVQPAMIASAIEPSARVTDAGRSALGMCPKEAPLRDYDVLALPVPVSYNHWGDVDLQGQLLVPSDEAVPLLDDVAAKVETAGLGELAASLRTLRAAIAAGDLQEAVYAAAEVEAQVAAPSNTPAGRIDTTELVRPLVLRAHVGECVRIVLGNTLPRSASIHVDSTIAAAGAGQATGMNAPDLAAPGSFAEFTVYLPPWPGVEGAHFLYSHADTRDQIRHGLFGAIVAEPVGSQWLSMKDGVTPAPTGLDAIIDMPEGQSDFREFVMFYQDEVDLVDWQLAPLPQVSPITYEYGVGTKAISLRTEPFYDRFLAHDQLFEAGETARAHDKSQSYGSYTYGDPGTHIQRSYIGDPVKFRVVNAGPGQPHIHHLHGGGIRWRTSPVADITQFDAGLLKDNPVQVAASQRVDVQNINPGESINVEPEGGSGGTQQSVGDFLYHCHIAEHYLAGMWSFWRVYNTQQADLAQLPDRSGRIAAAVDSTELIGDVMPDGTLLTSENLAAWVESMLPPRGVPGVEDASVWDWSVTQTAEGPLYLGEPESAIAFPNWPADAPGRLPPGERPSILFDPNTGRLAYPLLRPHFGERPPFAPDHGPAPYLGKDASPTRPDGLCNADARRVQHDVVAIPAVVKQNAHDIDPKAEVFVRTQDRAAATAPDAAPTSLVLRANAGDCVDVLFTNDLRETDVDEAAHGIHRKTNMHIHLVQFDVQASDGVVAGFNYETTVRPLDGSDRRATVVIPEVGEFPVDDPSAPVMTRVAGPLVVAEGATVVPVLDTSPFLDAVGAPKIGSTVGIGLGVPGTETARVLAVDTSAGTITLAGELAPHEVGERLGYEFVRYRWHADVELGVVYFHDHVNGLDTWRHGLYGSLVVEPRDSRWLPPDRASDDVEDDVTSPIVDVIPPAPRKPFREVVLHFMDRGCVDASDCVIPARPLPPDPVLETAAFNLRSEPLWRRAPDAPFSSLAPSPVDGLPQGDPATPLVRAYVGDEVEVRFLYAGQSNSRGAATFGVTGHRFQVEESLPGSRTQDAMSVAISAHHNWRLECGAGGCARQPGDYLYKMNDPEHVERGAWGLIRVLGERDETLKPLPRHGDIDVGEIPAPTRFYDIQAVETLVYHNAALYMSSTMQRFVPVGADLRPTLRSADPLVLRAVAGETIQVNLTNALPPGSGPVGLHAALLSAGPAGQGVTVGNGPVGTAAVGETISYVWHADRELGVVDLVSLADPVHDAANGLYGALVVEPAGATFDSAIGPSSIVHLADGTAVQEHVLLFASEDAQFDSSTMPYLPDVQGRTLVNYATEPLDHNAKAPTPIGEASTTGFDTCQVDQACAPRPLRVRNPANSIATQTPARLIATPVLEAQKHMPLVLRVVGAAGEQQTAFHLDGHLFATDPDMPGCRFDLETCRSNLVSTITVGPREGRNVWIPAAGLGGAGDHMYRNHRDAFYEAGAWGILRVS